MTTDVNGPGWTDEAVATALHCHRNTVANVRQRLVEQGLEAPRPAPALSRVDGTAEAKLIALRCGEPPDGYARWSLRLLADTLVEQEIVPEICHETVRQVLKKMY